MAWNHDTPSYPILTIEGTNEEAVRQGLAEWWAEIARRAAETEGEWDAMVGDAWVDSGRIIGHVQRRDQAVGFDTGFRVCANLPTVDAEIARADTLEDIDEAAEVHDSLGARIFAWATEARALEPAASALRALNAAHPFSLHLTAHGKGPLESSLRLSLPSE